MVIQPENSNGFQNSHSGLWQQNHYMEVFFVCVCVFVSALSRFGCVQLFATLWTVAHQAPLSMGSFRQECWAGLPFPTAGDLSHTGIEPISLALAGGFFIAESPYAFLKAIYTMFYLYLCEATEFQNLDH